ncbi:cell division protein FtsQ/DivIB [Collinsella tanakaei]|uniref:cell division protein FtsQ/DivIB n=1 Tax=Collinsella tanakaei TaxID=626935 RepID=UPI0025A4775C|nr:FtsQ-type POTRA domain-containing protein [Collinsella tanakaei]
MASSSSRKSNSSASKQKPTFRRSTGAASSHRSSTAKAAPSTPAAAPSRATPKRARTYTAPTKKSASLRVSSARTAKSSSAKPTAAAAMPGARKATPVTRKATPRAAAATSIARKGSAARGASTRVKATSATSRPNAPSAPKAKPARPQAAKTPRKKKLTLPASSSDRARTTTGTKGPSLGDRLHAVMPSRGGASPAPVAPARRDALQRPLAGLGSIGVARLAIVIVLLVAVMGGLGAAVVYNSGLFAATNVIVNGSAHIPQQTAEQLVDVPEGATLLNVNEKELSERLVENPWVESVNVEREFPHTLVITPVECDVSAIAYIVADDVAWAISDDDVWIAPLSVAVPQDDAASTDDDADGEATGEDDGTDVDADADAEASDADGEDADDSAEATASGVAAALKVAQDNDAVLLTDVGADVSPSSGKAVDSDVILAGLQYLHGFSPEFLAQVKDISVPSIEAISLNLDSGVEVSLGAPEDIQQKEQVIRSLLEQQEGVTYINVRVPDAYSFRSADV